jgi:hypothetical protein
MKNLIFLVIMSILGRCATYNKGDYYPVGHPRYYHYSPGFDYWHYDYWRRDYWQRDFWQRKCYREPRWHQR